MSRFPRERADSYRVNLASDTTAVLSEIARRIDAGHLRTRVGEILPLDQAGRAHRMLEGEPHQPGKIVLRVTA